MHDGRCSLHPDHECLPQLNGAYSENQNMYGCHLQGNILYMNVLRILGPEAKQTIIIRLSMEMGHHYCMIATTVYGRDVISNKQVLNWET